MHQHCTKHVSPPLPSKCIHHAPNMMNYNQDVISYMYAISTIKHVPIILLEGASISVPKVYQTCINYMNITTSSTHQLHVPICSSTTCQMHAPRYPTNMPLTIHHKIHQWNSNMYQPCTLTDLSQPPFTTTNTKHPKIHVLEVCLNRSMTSLASIIMIYLITYVP
jgi:hypothetical protein